MNPPETGVGLTWVPGLESVIEANAGLIDVLEVEPESLLRRRSGLQGAQETESQGSLQIDRAALEVLQRRSASRLVQSVNSPVGGTIRPGDEEIELLRTVAHELGAPWISQRLGFNRAADESDSWNTGVLLPLRQTLTGVELAAASVSSLATRIGVPVVIETGVNYLRPHRDELPDGEFVARVAEAADCGILLDLHNIWANQRNGRQSVGDYVEQLPLERVWEIHVSGGHFHRGFWIDSHTGNVPLDLLELAARMVPRLPNLKAIIFELVPSGVPTIGESAIRLQLEGLHRLWGRRNTAIIPAKPMRPDPEQQDQSPSPQEWENTLAALAVHKPCGTTLAIDLHLDPGVRVLREIVERWRAAMVVHALRLTSRLIMLERGTAYFEQLLTNFWRAHTPERWAMEEAEAFAAFLREFNPYVPFLKEILEYDCAVLAVAVDGEERCVSFGADPMPLLSALGAGRRPAEISSGKFEIRLTPDQLGKENGGFSEIPGVH